MKCYFCEGAMIIGGDHDCEDPENDDFSMVTNMSCSKCNRFVLVYHPWDDDQETTKQVDTL